MNKTLLLSFILFFLHLPTLGLAMDMSKFNENKIKAFLFSAITTKPVYDPPATDIWHQNVLPALSSPVDLSFLNANDIPAGRHGFIKRDKDQLTFADGKPVKFWGANIQAYTLFKASDFDIQRHAFCFCLKKTGLVD